MLMSDAVISALITAGLTLIGVVVSSVITSRKSQREIEHKLEVHQAVTDTKIEELTREVRQHNNFAQRMPVVEQEIKDLTKIVDKLQVYHME